MAGCASGDEAARARALVDTARSLATDAVTGEVVRAFGARDIRCILLKGPTVASWLYDDGSVRYYLDSDLWVEPARFDAAERELSRLGFERRVVPIPPKGALPHSEPWFRAEDRAEVDLHRTLSGVGLAPEDAWRLLVPNVEEMDVGGVRVAVLPVPVRALLVVLHAAQHGPAVRKPLDDLARVLRRLSDDEWSEVARMASLLDATAGFANGLRLIPAGRDLAERLGLVSSMLIEDATRHGSSARVALGLHRLARASGFRERLRLVARELVPTPSFLRWWSPLARRGPLGLGVVYLWRPFWLLWHLVPSLVRLKRSEPTSRAGRAR